MSVAERYRRKKSGGPWWVLVVLAVCAGVIFGAYFNTSQKPSPVSRGEKVKYPIDEDPKSQLREIAKDFLRQYGYVDVGRGGEYDKQAVALIGMAKHRNGQEHSFWIFADYKTWSDHREWKVTGLQIDGKQVFPAE